MLTVSCPSCGAPVSFRSHAAVMAVCEYCRGTLVRTGETVENMGRMSDVLEDYSPLQIGTAGEFDGRRFTLVGRIQLRYPAGLWNEWHAMFDDGESAWLAEFSGQYTFTAETPAAGDLPDFADIAAARSYTLLGRRYTAAEARVADCTGGEGELPFVVGAGWQARVADFRRGRDFLTLDYSDGGMPKAYAGRAVTLGALQAQFLRDDDTVRAAAGRTRAELASLACPACGSSVSYVPGVTGQVLCPACRARVDVSTPVAKALETADRLEKRVTTLALGDTASIGGMPYRLIGLMTRADEDGESWTEYLLYSVRNGLLWLVETGSGWSRAAVLDDWPAWPAGDTVRSGGTAYRRIGSYTATVTFAAGAFNWRVEAGENAQVIEFAAGSRQLIAEIGGNELNWSHAEPVPGDQVRAWFGKKSLPRKAPADYRGLARRFVTWLLVVNAIPLLLAFGATWKIMAFAAIAIYLPALALHWLGDRTP